MSVLPLDTMYGKLFLMSCDYIDSPACTAQNTHNNIHCTLMKEAYIGSVILNIDNYIDIVISSIIL